MVQTCGVLGKVQGRSLVFLLLIRNESPSFRILFNDDERHPRDGTKKKLLVVMKELNRIGYDFSPTAQKKCTTYLRVPATVTQPQKNLVDEKPWVVRWDNNLQSSQRKQKTEEKPEECRWHFWTFDVLSNNANGWRNNRETKTADEAQGQFERIYFMNILRRV